MMSIALETMPNWKRSSVQGAGHGGADLMTAPPGRAEPGIPEVHMGVRSHEVTAWYPSCQGLKEARPDASTIMVKVKIKKIEKDQILARRLCIGFNVILLDM